MINFQAKIKHKPGHLHCTVWQVEIYHVDKWKVFINLEEKGLFQCTLLLNTKYRMVFSLIACTKEFIAKFYFESRLYLAAIRYSTARTWMVFNQSINTNLKSRIPGCGEEKQKYGPQRYVKDCSSIINSMTNKRCSKKCCI